MNIPPTIYIDNASLNFGSHTLFSQLNYTLNAGTITCLLGSSGIGKTSLLRMLANLIPPNHCKANIRTSDDKPLSHRIAYMAQNDLLMPWLNVLDNILIGHRLRNTLSPIIRRQAHDLLKKIDLKEIAEYYPSQLSGGMRQRVALVRTIIENRPVILMDEPFFAVDAITRLELQNLMTELLRNHTVLLVTHDPLEALRISDHILVMAGNPVTLHQPIHLTSQTPRQINEETLLIYQSILLNLLSKKNNAISS